MSQFMQNYQEVLIYSIPTSKCGSIYHLLCNQ